MTEEWKKERTNARKKRIIRRQKKWERLKRTLYAIKWGKGTRKRSIKWSDKMSVPTIPTVNKLLVIIALKVIALPSVKVIFNVGIWQMRWQQLRRLWRGCSTMTEVGCEEDGGRGLLLEPKRLMDSLRGVQGNEQIPVKDASYGFQWRVMASIKRAGERKKIIERRWKKRKRGFKEKRKKGRSG